MSYYRLWMVSIMGAYDRIQNTFQAEYKERADTYKLRLTQWNKEPSIVRVEKPMNIARARRLGYKAKKGYFVVRVRIGKGNRRRVRTSGGRTSKHAYSYISPDISHKLMAEQRANRTHANAEVVNSYYVGETGKEFYYEVILADRTSPTVDKKIVTRKGKSYRGLTSSGKKQRGL